MIRLTNIIKGPKRPKRPFLHNKTISSYPEKFTLEAFKFKVAPSTVLIKPIEFPDNWQFSKPVPPTDFDDATLLDTGVTQTPLSSSSPESVSPNVEPEIKSTTITDLLMFLAKIGVSVVVVGSLVTGGFLVKKLGVSTLSTMDLAEIDAGWDNGVGISDRFCDAMFETNNSKLTIVAPIGFIPSDSYDKFVTGYKLNMGKSDVNIFAWGPGNVQGYYDEEDARVKIFDIKYCKHIPGFEKTGFFDTLPSVLKGQSGERVRDFGLLPTETCGEILVLGGKDSDQGSQGLLNYPVHENIRYIRNAYITDTSSEHKLDENGQLLVTLSHFQNGLQWLVDEAKAGHQGVKEILDPLVEKYGEVWVAYLGVWAKEKKEEKLKKLAEIKNQSDESSITSEIENTKATHWIWRYLDWRGVFRKLSLTA